MTALYKKLNITEEQLIEKLKTLYNNGLSQRKIARLLNCHPRCIERLFKKFNIKTRSQSEAARLVKQRNCSFSKNEMDIIVGLMLSDLYIEFGTFQARFAFGLKYLEFAKAITNNINSIEWTEIYAYKGKRTPNLNYFSKSKYYIDLSELHKKWYLDKVKIVPNDIILSPEILYWWYIGDGYLDSNRYGLLLCTEAFSKKENNLLVEKLKKLGFNCYLTNRNRIRFSGQKEMKKFLEFIGKPRLKCYEYKWNV